LDTLRSCRPIGANRAAIFPYASKNNVLQEKSNWNARKITLYFLIFVPRGMQTVCRLMKAMINLSAVKHDCFRNQKLFTMNNLECVVDDYRQDLTIPLKVGHCRGD
jgi:hypothetical protein